MILFSVSVMRQPVIANTYIHSVTFRSLIGLFLLSMPKIEAFSNSNDLETLQWMKYLENGPRTSSLSALTYQ